MVVVSRNLKGNYISLIAIINAIGLKVNTINYAMLGAVCFLRSVKKRLFMDIK